MADDGGLGHRCRHVWSSVVRVWVLASGVPGRSRPGEINDVLYSTRCRVKRASAHQEGLRTVPTARGAGEGTLAIRGAVRGARSIGAQRVEESELTGRGEGPIRAEAGLGVAHVIEGRVLVVARGIVHLDELVRRAAPSRDAPRLADQAAQLGGRHELT